MPFMLNDGDGHVQLDIPPLRSLLGDKNGVINTTAKVEIPEKPEKKFEHARYATTKSSVQAAMNVALVTSNASQLKSVIDKGPVKQNYYYFFLGNLVVSIGLQVIVGFLLAWVGSREAKLHDVQDKSTRKTKKISRYVTALLFIVSMINVIMNAFSANLETST